MTNITDFKMPESKLFVVTNKNNEVCFIDLDNCRELTFRDSMPVAAHYVSMTRRDKAYELALRGKENFALKILKCDDYDRFVDLFFRYYKP